MNTKQGQLFSHLRAPDESYLVVTALASELPTYLPERLLFTGVGKINATHVLTRYLERHPEVKTVINYGTAGGAYQAKKGELIKCSIFLQGDMDCGDLAGGPGITFGDDGYIADVLQFGTDGAICRTQDQFVTDIEALDMFQHLMVGNRFNVVDMEAYALAKVCAMMNRDFICYKYISDDANDDADGDWQQNVAKGEPLFYEVLKKEHLFTHVQ
jgi:adenosylhomocysteine nucleosidase